MPEPTARPASDGDPWLTVQQVSEELKLHPATLRRWIKTERLAAVRAGREWRVRRSEVERALMADASPAYDRQEAPALAEAGAEPVRIEAPRQIAELLMTAAPRSDESA